ncbi:MULTISPECIES: hypothetical protein [unclassified Streptomyces]|uniref:hypothetical protein n=1 Tax=unclassified Streptomyces TaxID=2593676 RepID=UPI0033BE0AE1
MNLRKLRPAGVVLTVLATSFAATSAQPAAAANSSCMIYPFTTTCTTNGVSANSSYHYVWIQVDNCDSGWFRATTRWKSWDTGNGVYVGRGEVTPGHYMRKKISGLYSSYRLRIDGDPSSYANIANSDPGWREGTWTC